MANQKPKIDPQLRALLTKQATINARIMNAYALGQRDPSSDWIFQNRVKTASAIIRAFGCSIEEALIVLNVPVKERPPIKNTLETREKAKNKRAKQEETKNNEALE